MAKKLSEDMIRKEFESKGSELLSPYKNTKTPLKFRCTKCGGTHSITWANYTKGRNKNLVCKECSQIKQPTIEEIKKEFESKGAKLLTTVYHDSHQKLDFVCSNCGNKHHITWTDYKQGYNKNLVCDKCKQHKQVSIEEIKEEFASKGAVLLTTEYQNAHQRLYFKCARCGKRHFISWNSYNNGKNKQLYCLDCIGRREYTIDWIKEEFASKGANLLTLNYSNWFQKLYFECSKCSTENSITLYHYLKGRNKNLLCPKCIRGNSYNPEGPYGKNRHNIDNQWYTYIKEFFNIPKNERCLYSAHHIIPFSLSEEHKLSITNGFPLLKEFHSRGYVNSQGVHDPYHKLRDNLNPENWEEEARLPFHFYKDFRFLNLSSKVVTTIIYRDEGAVKGELYKKKNSFFFKGLLFIPIYFEEMFDKVKAQIVYSIIRSKLYRYFPSIYDYTGQQFNKYYARNLTIKEFSSKEVKCFLECNHIQGYVFAEYSLALVTPDNDIVQVMTFGKPRGAKIEYELLRLCSKKNTSVVGGAQRLFKYFVRNFNPSAIITYCDIRFSSVDPKDTIYPKLGFRYDHYSKPNYKYYHPDYNRLFSRWQFQKHKLEEKLDNFDPLLSEEQNMLNNGYIRQYDCGNHVFIWER